MKQKQDVHLLMTRTSGDQAKEIVSGGKSEQVLCLFVKIETGPGKFEATSDKAEKLWFQKQ